MCKLLGLFQASGSTEVTNKEFELLSPDNTQRAFYYRDFLQGNGDTVIVVDLSLLTKALKAKS